MRETQGDGAGHGGGGLGHIGVESLKALTAATIIVLDRDQAALELVRGYGADHTVLDRARRRQRGRQAPGVDRRAERRGRLRLLGEQGAETKGWNLTRRAGSHHIIGYGGTVKIATIDIISSERNIDGSATWSAPTTWSS